MKKTKLLLVLAFTLVFTLMLSTAAFAADNKLSNSLEATVTVGGTIPATSIDVTTLDELKAALTNTSYTTINIKADISGIDTRLVVGRAVTINGGDKTLTFTNAINIADYGSRHGILVNTAGVTINNLKVVMAGAPTWQGVYGIQVYNTTGVVINNYTGSGADAALLVNGSSVAITGTTTVSGNEFGGIEVSKGTGLSNNSILTVTGTLVNTDEKYLQPTIWQINGQGTVSGGPTTTLLITKSPTEIQTQYYLTDPTSYITLSGTAFTGGKATVTAIAGEDVTITVNAQVNKASIGNAQLVAVPRTGGTVKSISDGGVINTATAIPQTYTITLNFATSGTYVVDIFAMVPTIS